jgi:hypothetical protein
MSTIQPGGHDSRDEELGPIGVLPSISHGQKTRLSVFVYEVFICDAAHHTDPSAPIAACTEPYIVSDVPGNFSP